LTVTAIVRRCCWWR